VLREHAANGGVDAHAALQISRPPRNLSLVF